MQARFQKWPKSGTRRLKDLSSLLFSKAMHSTDTPVSLSLSLSLLLTYSAHTDSPMSYPGSPNRPLTICSNKHRKDDLRTQTVTAAGSCWFYNLSIDLTPVESALARFSAVQFCLASFNL